MVLVGLGAILQGSVYRLGTLGHMGPGYFPIALGAALSLVGISMIAAADAETISNTEIKPGNTAPVPEWRGWGCISLALLLFVLLGRFGGLLPATLAIVFVSALGDRRNSLKDAMVLALAVLMVCIVVFWWALQMQFPLFNWG